MNFVTIIAIIVRIWVLTFFVWSFRWIVFPWLHTYPYIPPVYINVGLWRAFCMGLLLFTACTFVVLLVLWIFYRIVRRIAKKNALARPIKRLISKSTPFKQLIQTGLFDLFDAIVDSIWKRDIRILFRGLLRFWQRNLVLLAGDLGTIAQTLTRMDEEEEAARRNRIAGQQQAQGEPEEPEEPYYSGESRVVENKYQICLEQSLVPIYPSDTSMEKARKKLHNQSTTAQCQVDKLQAGFSVFSFS